MEKETTENITQNTNILDSEKRETSRKKTKFLLLILLAGIFLLPYLTYKYFYLPPDGFPVNETVEVPAGSTLSDVSKLMKEEGFIRSELVFFVYFTALHDTASLKASNYSFTEPLTLPELATKLTEGNYVDGLIKFTHIEGESVKDVANRATEVLPEFDEDEFIKLAKTHEGRLFPDTYMIPDTFEEEELLALFLNTFEDKMSPLKDEIAEHKLSLDEIIILASILERETNSQDSRRIVSGILQNRLEVGMPLQVDASLEYELNKPLAELTPEDLEIESPYNTYINAGLPPTPIGNPGLDTIKAILLPEDTEYMFYITGNDGNFYYAKDFDEHRRNIANYLR